MNLSSNLPNEIQLAIMKLSIPELVNSIEEFLQENKMTMTDSQLTTWRFLKKQRTIKTFLKEFEELKKENNKPEMRLLIKKAEEEGFDLEIEVSEDENEDEEDSEDLNEDQIPQESNPSSIPD